MSMQNFPMTAGELEYTSNVLREFEAILTDFEFKDENQKRRVIVQFTNLKVIRSIEPFTQPTTSLPFNFSTKSNSNWGKFLLSGVRFGVANFADLRGRKVRLAAQERSFTGTDGNEVAFLEWIITSVDDITIEASGTLTHPEYKDPMEEILGLIHGKTSQEFAAEFLRTPLGHSYQGKIFDGSFYTNLLEEGTVRIDENDRYQVI